MTGTSLTLACGIAVTLAGFLLARAVQRRCRMHPLLNPVLVGAAVVAALGLVLSLPPGHYQPTGTVFPWLLGPHVAVLAVPLYRYRRDIVRSAGVVFPAVAAGGVIAAVVALGFAKLAGAEDTVTATLATKSVTTAVAVELADLHGGMPNLTSLVVVLTGVFGACVVGLPHRLFGAPCPRAQGLALGVTAHAIGTARALTLGERTAAFASLGMILNALFTAATLPRLLHLLA